VPNAFVTNQLVRAGFIGRDVVKRQYVRVDAGERGAGRQIGAVQLPLIRQGAVPEMEVATELGRQAQERGESGGRLAVYDWWNVCPRFPPPGAG